MANKIVDQVVSLTAAVKDLKKEIDSLGPSLQKATTEASATFKDVAKVIRPSSGTNSNGYGPGQPTLGTDHAKFTTPSSSGVPSMMPWTLSSKSLAALQIGGSLVSGALGVAGSVMAMAPNLGDVVSNAGAYYGASIFGNVSRQSLESMTRQSMGQGFTSALGGAQAAAVLTNGMYYTPGSAAYKQSLKEVGGIALSGLNIANAPAAAAIGGLYSGQMGASMASLGITNLDKNGNPLPQVDIAKQLFNRLMPNQNGVSIYNNKKITKESVNENFQQVLASQLSQMGYSPDQIQVLQYQFGQLAEGKNADLSKIKSNKANPLSYQMQINTSEAGLLQKYEQPMLDGFQKAADLITGTVNPALEKFASTLGTAKGFLQGTGTAGAGAAGIAGSIFNTGSNIAETLLLSKLLGGGKGLGTLAKGGSLLGEGGMLSKLLGGGKALLKGGAIALGGDILGNVIQGNSKKGSAKHKVGSVAKDAAAGFALGTFLDPFTFGFGNEIGAGVGALIGLAHGGGSSGFGASFGTSSGNRANSPIPGVEPTTSYGAVDPSMWNGSKNSHTGQDYAVKVGTAVHAAADGIVFDDAPGFQFGTYVQIDHLNGFQTLYGHLSSKSVKVGDKVKAGQVIGKSGESGNVTGPHLHFEVRKGRNNPVDPSTFLDNGFTSNLYDSIASTGATPQPPNVPKGSQLVSGTVSKAAGVILGTGSQKSWAKDFLKGMGAPVTSTNVKAMTTWMAWEGGQWHNPAHYNPLNTTLNATGAADINSAGVKAYTSYSEGLQSNISTLKENQRGYSAIRSALMQGNNLKGVLTAVDKSAWGTHIPGYGGGSSGFGASFPEKSISLKTQQLGTSSVSTAVTAGAPVTNNININVSLTGVSESDAKAFAQRVKTLLQNESHISTVGSR